jgi:hypothetical protein
VVFCVKNISVGYPSDNTTKNKYPVGYATANDATTNECYNEEFL